MSDLISQAEETLLKSKGISFADLEETVFNLLSREVDYGEVFVQSTRSESFGVEDGIVKDGAFSVDAGIGVRALAGEKTGFAYSEDIRLDGLQQAAKAARSIAKKGASRKAPAFNATAHPALYEGVDPISSLSDAEKVVLLRQVDMVARAEDSRVKEVNVRISASHESMLIMASDGTLAADIRPLVRLDVSVIVQQGERRERGSAGGGGRRSLFSLSEGDWAGDVAK